MFKISQNPELDREALMQIWRALYDVQVLVAAMDEGLLAEIEQQVEFLQYRVRSARLRVNATEPRHRRTLRIKSSVIAAQH